jgi:hypothetical protein
MWLNRKEKACLVLFPRACLYCGRFSFSILWWGGSHPYHGVLVWSGNIQIAGIVPETNNQAFSPSPFPQGGSRPLLLSTSPTTSQYSFYLEVIVFCPFRTQVLFPMSSGNALGLFNQTNQTWMATCINILQSNGLRNGSAFSGLVDGTGQAMMTFGDNTWGINLSTCYKYCDESAIPLV